MSMDQNLSSYPPTLEGSQDILNALTPAIRTLWKSEPRSSHDLVVIIDTRMNTIKLAKRSSIYAQLRHHNPKISLLARLRTPPKSPNGTMTIWAITGFTEGNVFISPVVLAQS